MISENNDMYLIGCLGIYDVDIQLVQNSLLQKGDNILF